MDFGYSAAEQAFAEEVRAFLQAHPPETFPLDGTDAGYGSGAHSRAFTAALGERGWLSLTWPRELLAGLQRAGRGLRSPRPRDPGAPRRRPLGARRPQDLVEPRRHRDLR